MAQPFTLRDLPLGVRLGILSICAVFGVGLAASFQHMKWHHEKRDERPGLTVDDVKGAYHGIRTRSPLVTALERGHPETMKQPQRDALTDWLLGKKDASGARPKDGNPKLSSDFDNLDLGDNAPSEIIRTSCLECHARSAADKHPIAKQYPLDYWDDVKAIAFSREVNPTDPKKLAISIHAHALGMAPMAVVIACGLWLTAWPRRLASLCIFVASFGLLADFVGQIVAREHAWAVWLIVGGGAAFNGLAALMLVGISIDVLRPRFGAK